MGYITQSNTATINVYSQLSATISPTSVNMTVGGTQQFNSTVTGGLTPYSYQWYYSNGTAIAGSTSSTLVYKANITGTFNLYLNVTDSFNNKTQSNTATLNIYSQPTVTINPTSVNMTLGGTQQFNSTVSGGLVPYAYQWYYLNGTTIAGATASSLTFKANATGTFNIYLNVTDNVGYKTQSNTATINVPSQPSTIISPNSVNMTVGSSNQFTSSTIGGLIPYSYQWYQNNSAILGATSANLMFNATSAGTYNIYLNVTDSNHFTVKSNTATARVETPANVTITPTHVQINVGQSQTFNSTTSNGTIPYSYQWYLNDSAASGATSQNWTFTPAVGGTYKVYLNVTDALNFITQSNIVTDITVYSQLSVSISPVSINMTTGTAQTFASTVSGGVQPYTYQWYLNGSQVPNANAATWMFTPASTGHFNVYVVVTDNKTAFAQSNNATITVETPTNVNITPTHVEIYLGQSQTFNCTVSGGTQPYSYQWYLNDTPVSSATYQNWTFTPTIAGTYKVYQNITDNLNIKTQSNIITDITVYPQLTVTISPPSVNMTVGTSQTFNCTISGGDSPYAYQWYMNGTAISGATNSNWTCTPTSTGTYNIYSKVTDDFNTTSQSNTVIITVSNPSSAAFDFGTSSSPSTIWLHPSHRIYPLLGNYRLRLE